MKPYLTTDTSVIDSGQFIKTVAATTTPEALWPGVAQVFTVLCVADVSGNLAGKYFDCYDSNGTVRVYFTVGGTGTRPAQPNAGRITVVNVTSGDADTVVAEALKVVLEADSEFTASRSTATVTVTQSFKGERATPLAQTSGFTTAATTAGVATKKLVPSVSLTGKNARGTDNTGDVFFGYSATNDTQLERIAAGKTVVLRAPLGGSIDLGKIYLDVATNSDGAVVSFPAIERYA